MSRFKLKEIEIKSFRGIKNYILNFDDKSLVLVGENGCGKSSIVNAFEFLFTGKVESLSGTHSIKHKQALVHLNDKPEDLFVRLKVGKKDITRTLKKSPERDDFIKDFENGSFLLNRQKLLNFIDNTPSKRYNRITTLIGFDELDEIENKLNKTKKLFKSKAKNKEDELNSKIKSICEIYDCEFDEVTCKINETLSKNDLKNIDENTDLNEFLNQLSQFDFKKVNQLQDLISLLDVDISKVNVEFEELLNSYEDATLYELKSTNNLLSILNKSSDYISKETPTNCPVCQNNINTENVLEYIQHKKEELNENENSLKNWKNDYQKFNKTINDINITLKHIKNALFAFEEYEFDFDLDEFIRDLDRLSKFEIKLSEIKSDTLTNLDGEFQKLKNSVESDFEKLNDSENINDLNNVHEVILKLKDKTEIENELKILEKQSEISEKTYEVFKDKKQETLKEIISKIEDDVARYYNFIHDDEVFNTPKIDVPKSNGLTLNLNFNETDADPRTYSSEGHLDSLGLCVFLAFAKQFNKFEFLILDDIVSTVDLGHKERVAKLLFTEFKNYRFIITTHNKLWFRQLKNHVDNNNLRDKFNFCEIRGIGSETGPILIPTMYKKEIINKHIENADTFAAGNSIRRYLESVLEKVCKANRLKIPLNDHLMINDYFSAVNSFFNEVLDGEDINPELKAYYKDIISRLDANRYMGNLSSHNDDDNCFVSINEVEEFRDIVFEFEKAMTCKKHKTRYLIFNKETKIVTCSRNDCDLIFSLKNKAEM